MTSELRISGSFGPRAPLQSAVSRQAGGRAGQCKVLEKRFATTRWRPLSDKIDPPGAALGPAGPPGEISGFYILPEYAVFRVESVANFKA